MTSKERYFWDLSGHLILRGVLTKDELDAANTAIDAYSDRINPGEPNRLSRGSQSLQGIGRPSMGGTQLLNLDKPHCDIFRRMLVHPAVVDRLRVMCGPGFRLDHGPQFIGGVKGTSGHRLHGSGAPHKPYVGYHHQGEPYVGGVTVSWQLAEVIEGQGGFACVPGSQVGLRSARRGHELRRSHGHGDPARCHAGRCFIFHGWCPDARYLPVAKRPRAPLDPLQVRQPKVSQIWQYRLSAECFLGYRNRRRHERRTARGHVGSLQRAQGAQCPTSMWTSQAMSAS